MPDPLRIEDVRPLFPEAFTMYRRPQQTRRCSWLFGWLCVWLLPVSSLFGGGPSLDSTIPRPDTTSCIADIERWFRELQARHYYLGSVGSNDGILPLNWPACCPDSASPPYPRDDLYDDALLGNEDLAVELVRALLSAFCALYPNFVPETFDPAGLSLDTASVPPNFVPGDFPLSPELLPLGLNICDIQPWEVTRENYCAIYRLLVEAIKRLRVLRYDPECICIKYNYAETRVCEYREWQALGATRGEAYASAKASAVCCFETQRSPSGCASPDDCSPWPCCSGACCQRCECEGWRPCPSHPSELPDPDSPSPVIAPCWLPRVYEGVSIVPNGLDCHPDRPPLNPPGYMAFVTLMRVVVAYRYDLRNDPGTLRLYTGVRPECNGPYFETPGGIPGDGKWYLLSTISGGQEYESPPYGDGGTPVLPTMPGEGESCCDPGETPPCPNSRRSGWRGAQPFGLWEPEFDTRPDPEVCGSSCATCTPGMPEFGDRGGGSGLGGTYEDCTTLSWPLGLDPTGRDAGRLRFHGCDLTRWRPWPPCDLCEYRPPLWNDPIISTRPNSTLQVNWGALGTTSSTQSAQIVTGRYVVNLQQTIGTSAAPGSSGTIDFYHQADMQQVGGVYEPQPGVSPFATTILTYSEIVNGATTTRRLDVAYSSPSGSGARRFEQGGAGNGRVQLITDSQGAALRQVDASSVVSGAQTVTTRVVSAAATGQATRTVDTTRLVDGRPMVTERRWGSAGVELVESRSYYEAPQAPAAHAGKLKHLVSTSGHWQHFVYDAAGRLSRHISQFKTGEFLGDAEPMLSSSAVTNTETWIAYRGPLALGGGLAAAESIVERRDYLLGEPVALSYSVTLAPDVGAGTTEEWDIQCESAASLTDAQLQTFLQMVITPAIEPGTPGHIASMRERETAPPYRTLRSWSTDGNLTLHVRAEDPVTHERSTTTWSGPSNADRTGVRGGTKRIMLKQASGATIFEEELDIENPADPLTRSRRLVDIQNHPEYVDRFGRVLHESFYDGTFATRAYGCCGLASTTDRDGVTTTYQYDELHRVKSTTRGFGAGKTITTTLKYDADGRVLEERRTGTDGVTSSEIVVSTATYDLAGRPLTSTNALGYTTSHTYTFASGLSITTTTLPDPDLTDSAPAPTVIRSDYPDGSPASVGGTGARPVVYDYGRELIGGVQHRFTKKSRGAGGTQWTKTLTNPLGQHVRTVFADGAFSTNDYSAKGELRRSVDPDGVTTLHYSGYGPEDRDPAWPTIAGLDWIGAWRLSVQDSADSQGVRNGLVDFGGRDRITMTQSRRATRTTGGQTLPVSRTTTRVWTTDTHAAATHVVNTSDVTFDGLRSFQQSGSDLSETLSVTDTATATRTVTTTAPSGARAIATSRYGREESTVRRSPTDTFAGSTHVVYDEHGRVKQSRFRRIENDPTKDTITDYTYSDADQVLTQTDPDPEVSPPSGVRMLHTFTYDRLGRTIKRNVNDPGTSAWNTNYTYFDTGEVASVRGFEANPVQHVYDDLGRMTELRTFKKGSDWTGEAVTTWYYSPARGFLSAKTYNDGQGLQYLYTPAGRLSYRIWARGVETNYAYNEFGDLKEINYADTTPDVAVEYDRQGRLKTVKDAAGIRQIGYDADSRPTSEAFAWDPATGADVLAGVQIANHYNTAGLRDEHAVTIATETRSVTYGYDSWRRLKSVERPGAAAVSEFDPVTGEHTWTHYSKGIGQTEVFNGERLYDQLGRLKSLTWRIASNNQVLESYTYTYDELGRRAQLHYSDGSYWDYIYDNLGQLTDGVRRFSNGYSTPGEHFGYRYDDIGNRKFFVEGGGYTNSTPTNLTSSAYSSNLLNQYTSRAISGNIEVVGDSQSAASAMYVYSDDETIEPGTQAWRLPPAGTDNFYHRRVPFDNTVEPVSSRINLSEIPGEFTGYPVFIPKTPESFQYDADGNLTLDGIWVYEWDGENRLKAMWMRPEVAAVRLGGDDWVRLEFSYDWMGRRISKKYLKGSGDTSWSIEKASENVLWGGVQFEKFVWDGWTISLSYRAHAADGSFLGLGQSQAWGPDLSGSAGGAGGIGGLAIRVDEHWDASNGGNAIGPMFPMYDGNGNVTRVYAANQNLLTTPPQAKYEYGPFGEVRSIFGINGQGQRNPWRWSTKYTDAETGLVYYGYRYYSAGTGRWLNRDPIHERGGVNLLAFVVNAPTRFADSLGLEPNATDCFTLNFHISKSLNTPIIPVIPGVSVDAGGWLQADLELKRCRYKCCEQNLRETVDFQLAGSVGGRAGVTFGFNQKLAFGSFSARVWGGVRVSGESIFQLGPYGGRLRKYCEGPDDWVAKVCFQMTIGAVGEFGAEAEIEYRGWYDFTVGAVAYARADVGLKGCLLIDGDGNVSPDGDLAFLGVAYAVGVRACVFGFCFDEELINGVWGGLVNPP